MSGNLLVWSAAKHNVLPAGLLEETEQEEMQRLVEIRLSRLHFGAPHFPLPFLRGMLGEHPLFEHLDDEELRTEVGADSLCTFINLSFMNLILPQQIFASHSWCEFLCMGIYLRPSLQALRFIFGSAGMPWSRCGNLQCNDKIRVRLLHEIHGVQACSGHVLPVQCRHTLLNLCSLQSFKTADLMITLAASSQPISPFHCLFLPLLFYLSKNLQREARRL